MPEPDSNPALAASETEVNAARRAVAAAPDSGEARFRLALALFLTQEWDEAQSVLGGLLTTDPTFPNALWLYAGLLRRRHGDLHPDVLDAYEQAAAAMPPNHYARCECADVRRAHQQYREALELYREVSVAASCLDEGLRLEADFNRASVALTLGETEEAREALRAVLETDPDYPDAQELYALLEE